MTYRRPILLNGIESPARSADLVDRSLITQMDPIDEAERRTEEEIAADLASCAGELVGAVFDAVSAALRSLDETPRARWARMADATTWALAAADALGSDRDELEAVLRKNRTAGDELVLERSVFAEALFEFAIANSGWEGTVSALRAELAEKTDAGKAAVNTKDWPATVQAATSRIARELPVLRRRGVDLVDLPRTGSARLKRLTHTPRGEVQPERDHTSASLTSRSSSHQGSTGADHDESDASDAVAPIGTEAVLDVIDRLDDACLRIWAARDQ